jgi:hypothetical protein
VRRTVLLLALAALSCARYRPVTDRLGDSTLPVYEARVLEGDDPRFASPTFDDSRVPVQFLYAQSPPRSVFWIRARITPPHVADGKPLGIYVGLLGSIEVFWDGSLAGRSGTIANGRAATAGPLDNFFAVRNEPGPHLLAVRVAPSQLAERLPYFSGIAAGDYATMVRARVLQQVMPLSGLGIFVIIGLYVLSLWFAAGRRHSMLVLALLCFAASLLVVTETWRWVVGYPYDWHLVRLQLVAALTFTVAVLLPLFFVLELGVPRRRLWLLAIAIATVTASMLGESYDDRCRFMLAGAVAISAAATIAAIPRRRFELLPTAAGLGILGTSLALQGYDFNDHAFFLSFCALLLGLLVSMALETRRQRREHESALLRASRLEIELLKKSIQPHFLMNTLTAMMEWIDENPAEGVRLLEVLAEELRIFGEISGQSLIPVARELQLCRAHLTIMGCRKGGAFRLDTDGVDDGALVPPAIFHTLVENAITHNGYDDSADVVFTLREERADRGRRYLFDSPVHRQPAATPRDGLGLRYVRARLEEAFPGRWSLDSGPDGSSWRTTIVVR